MNAVLASATTSPSQQAAQHEQQVVLADMLNELSADYREVIILRNLEELPHSEVAQRMGRTEGAVRDVVGAHCRSYGNLPSGDNPERSPLWGVALLSGKQCYRDAHRHESHTPAHSVQPDSLYFSASGKPLGAYYSQLGRTVRLETAVGAATTARVRSATQQFGIEVQPSEIGRSLLTGRRDERDERDRSNAGR